MKVCHEKIRKHALRSILMLVIVGIEKLPFEIFLNFFRVTLLPNVRKLNLQTNVIQGVWGLKANGM